MNEYSCSTRHSRGFWQNLKARATAFAVGYRALPQMDLAPRPANRADPEHGLIRAFLFGILPAWFGAGVADWWWHRKTDIAHTAGLKESLLHVMQFVEVGIPLLIGLVCKIDRNALRLMWGTAIVHEFTAIADVAYAARHREVEPGEQHVHAVLEMLPFTACLIATVLRWDAVRKPASDPSAGPFKLRLKDKRLPDRYWPAFAGMVLIVAGLYGNELYRCHRARRRHSTH